MTPQENINDQTSKRPKKYGKIPKTVWQIGIVMLLMNMSYVMSYSFSALYFKHIMATSVLSIGFIEGICEFVSNGMKLFSGMLSDFFKKRKGVIVFGYAFSLLSKILFALSSSLTIIFSAKMMERFGNGVLASPRDAIVADIAPRKRIGASYGLKRSLAFAGSLLGGVAGFLAMTYSNNDYKFVFALAVIPAVTAVALLVIGVKEPKRFDHPAITSGAPMPAPKLPPKFQIKNFKYLGASFWVLMLVNFVYMLARMNESFLILHMNDGFQTAPKFGAIVMIVLNLGSAITAYPIGLLGDKFNRVKVLFVAVLFLMLSDIVMYTSTSQNFMYLGIFFWGVQIGIVQNIFISLIAEKVPEDLRGTGIGIFWLTTGISAFFADYLAGYVAETFALKQIFISSCLIGVVALLILTTVSNSLFPRAKEGKQ